MYASFFGLKQPPFSIAPDPRYLYMSERHREALAHLLYGVQGGGGFVLLSGEIGAGKTTVCRCFLEQVPSDCQVAYIFNPQLTVPELLQTVCDEFGIAVPAGTGPATLKTYIDALNAHLLAAHAQGRQCLLIIDEAQHLSADVLEQLRLLTNLETPERKLLQIILIGQPELRSLLAGAGLEQLAQRVIARYHLGALSAAETAAYVAHRMAVAGLGGPLPFDGAALRRIHAISGGVPRRINLLCDRALLGAFAEGRPKVGVRIVERAAREVFDGNAPAPRPRRGWRLAGGALALAVALLAAGWLVGWLVDVQDVLDGATARRAPAAAGAVAPAASPATAPAASAATGTTEVARPGIAGASEPAAAGASEPAAARPSDPAPAAVLAAGGVAPVHAGAPSAAAPAAGVSSAPMAAAPAGAGGSAPPSALPALLPWAGLSAFPVDEAQAWRELAPLWGWQVPATMAADPCQGARSVQLRCFRTAGGNLALLQRLDRPVLLLLREGDGAPRHARLMALDPQRVVLAAGERHYALPVDDLARWWRGEFAALWRAPEGYPGLLQPGAAGPAVDALARGLATLQRGPAPSPGQALSGALAQQLAAFQRSQGMRPDGVAGPATFMQLNRALGVAEPRLATGWPER